MIKIDHETYNEFIPVEGKVFREYKTGHIYFDLSITLDKEKEWVEENFEEIEDPTC